jgi:hypothetical protein
MGWSHSPETGSTLISQKPLKSPALNQFPFESQPYPTECHVYFGKNRWNPQPLTNFLLKVNPIPLSVMFSLGDFTVTLIIVHIIHSVVHWLDAIRGASTSFSDILVAACCRIWGLRHSAREVFIDVLVAACCRIWGLAHSAREVFGSG